MNTPAATGDRPPRRVVFMVWCCVIGLAFVGLFGATARTLFPSDLAARLDPARPPVLEFFHVVDPFAADRAAVIREFDRSFASHPVVTMLHVIPGGLYLALGLLQFSERIRNRYRRFHRWSGRVLVLSGLVVVATGLYFAIAMPFGGFAETIAILLFGLLFLVSLTRAFIAARRRQFARHREWMLRAFAVGLGVAAVRLVGAPCDLILTAAGFRAPEMFVISLWIGFGMMVIAGEVWIRYTRKLAGRSPITG